VPRTAGLFVHVYSNTGTSKIVVSGHEYTAPFMFLNSSRPEVVPFSLSGRVIK